MGGGGGGSGQPALLSNLIAWGEKLFFGLVVRAQTLLNLLPDGSGQNNPAERWVLSFTILIALLIHRTLYMSSIDGSLDTMMFKENFTTLCRIRLSVEEQLLNQTVMLLVKMLSTTHL